MAPKAVDFDVEGSWRLPLSFCDWWGGGVVCTVIFVSNQTTVLRLCCVELLLGLWQQCFLTPSENPNYPWFFYVVILHFFLLTWFIVSKYCNIVIDSQWEGWLVSHKAKIMTRTLLKWLKSFKNRLTEVLEKKEDIIFLD